MAQKPETLFKNRIKPQLESLASTWFVKVQQVAMRGTPDFLLCINGRFVAIELKASAKDKASKLQEWTLDQISKAGGIALIACPENWAEVKELLINLSKGTSDVRTKVRPLDEREFSAGNTPACKLSRIKRSESTLQHNEDYEET